MANKIHGRRFLNSVTNGSQTDQKEIWLKAITKMAFDEFVEI
jgi:hypothetical protein